jgi:hypothetical protein
MLIYGFGNTPTAEAPKGIAEVLYEAFLRRDSLAGAGPMPTQIGDVVVTPSSKARCFRMWVVTEDAQQAPTAGQWLRHVEGMERVKATAREHAGKDRVFFVDDVGWTYWR